jgi:hypothetical protein
MNGDVHVRFRESQGLQRPWPLAKKAKKTKAKKAGKHKKKRR